MTPLQPAIWWINRIENPEIREKVLGWVRDYPHEPNKEASDVVNAISLAINQYHMPSPLTSERFAILRNPPSLLPETVPFVEEREKAEALLNEFAEFFNGEYESPMPVRQDDIDNFLATKYKS